jgi:hypothetical protein
MSSDFETELEKLYELKPPISASRIQTLTKLAYLLHRVRSVDGCLGLFSVFCHSFRSHALFAVPQTVSLAIALSGLEQPLC